MSHGDSYESYDSVWPLWFCMTHMTHYDSSVRHRAFILWSITAAGNHKDISFYFVNNIAFNLLLIHGYSSGSMGRNMISALAAAKAIFLIWEKNRRSCWGGRARDWPSASPPLFDSVLDRRGGWLTDWGRGVQRRFLSLVPSATLRSVLVLCLSCPQEQSFSLNLIWIPEHGWLQISLIFLLIMRDSIEGWSPAEGGDCEWKAEFKCGKRKMPALTCGGAKCRSSLGS